jgi:hypothetical protein
MYSVSAGGNKKGPQLAAGPRFRVLDASRCRRRRRHRSCSSCFLSLRSRLATMRSGGSRTAPSAPRTGRPSMMRGHTIIAAGKGQDETSRRTVRPAGTQGRCALEREEGARRCDRGALTRRRVGRERLGINHGTAAPGRGRCAQRGCSTQGRRSPDDGPSLSC